MTVGGAVANSADTSTREMTPQFTKPGAHRMTTTVKSVMNAITGELGESATTKPDAPAGRLAFVNGDSTSEKDNELRSGDLQKHRPNQAYG